jgi:hypothetical protein
MLTYTVRLVEKCLDILVAAVQYTFTHKQCTDQIKVLCVCDLSEPSKKCDIA